MDDNKIPITTSATTDTPQPPHAPGDTFQPSGASPAPEEPAASPEPTVEHEPEHPVVNEVEPPLVPPVAPVPPAPEPPQVHAAAPEVPPEPVEPALAPVVPPETHPLHVEPEATVVAHDAKDHPNKKRSFGKALGKELLLIAILLVVLAGGALAYIYFAKV